MKDPIHCTVFGSIGNSDVGDDSYLEASIHAIEASCKTVEWTILSACPEETEDRLARPSILGFMRADPPGGKGLSVYGRALRQLLEWVLWGFFYGKSQILPQWLSKRSRDLLRAMTRADVIVNFGGGSLNGDYRKAFLSEIAFFWLCRRMGKATALLGQSVGPFYNKWSRRAAMKALRGVDLLTIREQASLEFLHSLGAPPPKAELTADSALLGGKVGNDSIEKVLKDNHIPANSPAIGFSVRYWYYPEFSNPEAKHRTYVQAMGQLADRIVEDTDGYILLIPSATRPDDPKTCGEVMDYMKRKERARIIGDGKKLALVRSAVSACDCFIGTRFHPIVFATSSGVPTMVVSYTAKCEGYMKSLGRPELVCRIENVNGASLIDMFNALWTRRTEERHYLLDKTAEMRDKAQRNIDLLLDLMDSLP